jgi:hypothetical protein
MSDRNELIIAALQQKIGEIVSNYETQIAILRAELTLQSINSQERSQAIDEYEQEIAQIGDK